MALTPRMTIDDGYAEGKVCAICGAKALRVVHLQKYPDFVQCDQCQSAFVVEDGGNWVMYGNIGLDLPETKTLALRQWTWMDAVQQRAEEERQEADDQASHRLGHPRAKGARADGVERGVDPGRAHGAVKGRRLRGRVRRAGRQAPVARGPAAGQVIVIERVEGGRARDGVAAQLDEVPQPHAHAQQRRSGTTTFRTSSVPHSMTHLSLASNPTWTSSHASCLRPRWCCHTVPPHASCG